MMKIFRAIILASLLSAQCHAQQNILDSPQTQKKVAQCLYAMYGFNFNESNSLQNSLQRDLPMHPAPYFLKALIIYWENFPLLPDNPAAREFELFMDRAIDLSSVMLHKDPESMEGVFFDMHARAFKGMFWADNGKPGRVISDIDNMYRSTMKGIEFKEVFSEFYFSSGLYNYYIEAYVEKHPMYRPIAMLFRKGDKKLGLKELEYAIHSTTYIRYEAILFMSLIQLNYEKNIQEAQVYAEKLYNYFPKNIYYLGQYLIILVHNREYNKAALINRSLENSADPFNKLIYKLIEGFLSENQRNETARAKILYFESIALAEKYGPIADLYASIAYAGLARISERENDPAEARRYQKKSSKLSVYEFILDF
jgi:hypothetical protein